MIDDLVHEAEVEAEVLRAVSHMAPQAAEEFLLRVALKIRHRREPEVEVTPAKVSPAKESTIVTGLYTRRADAVCSFLRRVGSATTGEVIDACLGTDKSSVERNRIRSCLYAMQTRGVLRKDDDKFYLAPEMKLTNGAP